MKCEINGLPYMQYTTANVWNTSLIGYTLKAAGISHEDPMVTKANNYLLSRPALPLRRLGRAQSQRLAGRLGFAASSGLGKGHQLAFADAER